MDNHVVVKNNTGLIFLTLLGVIVAVTFLWITFSTDTTAEVTLADPANRDQVRRGEGIYAKYCSSCHGQNLEGQANWRVRGEDKKLPAPPMNGTGHTWHHADDLLFGMVKSGLVPPYAPEGYQSNMPAWGGILSDSEIWAVLAYVKSQWPAEIRKTQSDINQEAFGKL